MVEPTRLPDGRIKVYATALKGDGDSRVIGDGMNVIGPGDPGYEAWDAYLKDTRSERKD